MPNCLRKNPGGSKKGLTSRRFHLLYCSERRRSSGLKKKKNLPVIPVIITISLVFLWLPIFISYYGLSEADFLTSGFSYENTDLHLLPGDQRSQLLLWGSNLAFPSEQGPHLNGPPMCDFLCPFIVQENPLLRC